MRRCRALVAERRQFAASGPPSHATAATLTGGVSDMRASRLVSIILLLQARGRMTAGHLGRRAGSVGPHHLPGCRLAASPLLCPDQRGSARRCCASLPLTAAPDSDVEPCASYPFEEDINWT